MTGLTHRTPWRAWSSYLVVVLGTVVLGTVGLASSAEAQPGPTTGHSSRHRFDGLVVRADLGFAGGRAKYVDPGGDPRSVHLDPYGVGLTWSLSAGWAVLDGLVLHADAWGLAIENGAPLTTYGVDGRYDVVAGGGGATLYLPFDLHLSLSGGVAFHRARQFKRATTGDGLSLRYAFGKLWWPEPRFGLGVSLVGTHTRPSNGPDWQGRWSHFFGVALSTAYD